MDGVKEKIVDKSLLEHTKKAMYRYGTYTNEDRAIPDFRDGYKPVQRRIMWTMHHMPKVPTGTKTSRVAGTTIGIYHPHGDASVADTCVNLVQACAAPLIGKGNFGTATDGAAAPRYTNILLSKYGESFLVQDYLEVTDYVINYDGTEKEPVLLPSLLPNLLLNGVSGIGVGTTCNIPAFSPESVIAVCVRLLKGEKLTPKDFASALEFRFAWGGVVVNTKANREAIVEYMKTGIGSVKVKPRLKVSQDGHKIIWDDFPPGVSIEKTIERLRDVSGVANAKNVTARDGVAWEINLVKSIKGVALESLLSKIKGMLSSSVSYRTNVAQREKVDDTEVSVKLFSSSIPELFKLWLEWRVELEKKCLAYRLKKQEKQIAYTELLIYAIGHIDTIAASLKTKDPHAYLMKALKISKEDANTILQLRVIQLSKLDGERLKERLAEEKERHGQLAKWLKKPSSKVAVDMEVILKGASKLVSPRVTSLYSRKESRA